MEDNKTGPGKICKDFVEFGWGKPSVCNSESGFRGPMFRFRHLVDYALDQLMLFREGVMDPLKTYGPTIVSDRVYLVADSSAIYTYDPVTIYHGKFENERSQKACRKVNSELACVFFDLVYALEIIEYQSEYRHRFN